MTNRPLVKDFLIKHKIRLGLDRDSITHFSGEFFKEFYEERKKNSFFLNSGLYLKNNKDSQKIVDWYLDNYKPSFFNVKITKKRQQKRNKFRKTIKGIFSNLILGIWDRKCLVVPGRKEYYTDKKLNYHLVKEILGTLIENQYIVKFTGSNLTGHLTYNLCNNYYPTIKFNQILREIANIQLSDRDPIEVFEMIKKELLLVYCIDRPVKLKKKKSKPEILKLLGKKIKGKREIISVDRKKTKIQKEWDKVDQIREIHNQYQVKLIGSVVCTFAEFAHLNQLLVHGPLILNMQPKFRIVGSNEDIAEISIPVSKNVEQNSQVRIIKEKLSNERVVNFEQWPTEMLEDPATKFNLDKIYREDQTILLYDIDIDFSELNLYRVFHNCDHGELTNGGRFYGSSYQYIKSIFRELIKLNGESTVEVDYSACHPNILFDLAETDRKNIKDFYDFGGIDRQLMKGVVLRIINNNRPQDRKKSICKFLDPFCPDTELTKSDKYSEAEYLYNVFAKKYPEIIDFLKTLKNPSSAVQYIESEIMLSIFQSFHSLKMPVLGIHDSIIVPEQNKELAKVIMIKCYQNYFLPQIVGEPKINGKVL